MNKISRADQVSDEEFKEICNKVYNEILKDQGCMSFVNLEDYLRRLSIEVEGDGGVGNLEYNIAFWMYMSDIFIKIVQALLREGRIEYVPASPLIYTIDGKCPTMPIAKSVRVYKNMRWNPVTLRAL